jgi:eukaryotic-like serine/threonine-protein kinase
MVDDPRVLLLLEEIMNSGRAPLDVCRTCPELLPAVLEGLERLRDLEAEIKAIFPARGPQEDEPQDPGDHPEAGKV